MIHISDIGLLKGSGYMTGEKFHLNMSLQRSNELAGRQVYCLNNSETLPSFCAKASVPGASWFVSVYTQNRFSVHFCFLKGVGGTIAVTRRVVQLQITQLFPHALGYDWMFSLCSDGYETPQGRMFREWNWLSDSLQGAAVIRLL